MTCPVLRSRTAQTPARWGGRPNDITPRLGVERRQPPRKEPSTQLSRHSMGLLARCQGQQAKLVRRPLHRCPRGRCACSGHRTRGSGSLVTARCSLCDASAHVAELSASRTSTLSLGVIGRGRRIRINNHPTRRGAHWWMWLLGQTASSVSGDSLRGQPTAATEVSCGCSCGCSCGPLRPAHLCWHACGTGGWYTDNAYAASLYPTTCRVPRTREGAWTTLPMQWRLRQLKLWGRRPPPVVVCLDSDVCHRLSDAALWSAPDRTTRYRQVDCASHGVHTSSFPGRSRRGRDNRVHRAPPEYAPARRRPAAIPASGSARTMRGSPSRLRQPTTTTNEPPRPRLSPPYLFSTTIDSSSSHPTSGHQTRPFRFPPAVLPRLYSIPQP